MRLHRSLSGAPVRLDKELGRGGEGAVFAVHGHPNLVAKIYLKPPTPEKIAKLQAMARLASPAILSIAAWPIDVLHDDKRVVRGFLMPRVTSREDLHELYSPKSRAATFPDADFRFVARVATNIARAFAVVHSHGHVIGDVNHGNALVGADGTVVLIDCDSFQIRDRVKTYPCDVGVPLFTPPELQGKNFRGLRRSANHDAFGLATLTFHLLFQGRHPFAGRYAGGEMTIERAIAEHRFAYGPTSAALGMSAPPGTLPLTAFGSQISESFTRAFLQPAARGERPTAREWIDALQALEESLIQCEHAPTHFHPNAQSERTNCCWCDLERQTGIRLFGRRLIAAGRAAAIEIETVWRAIMETPHPGPAPALPTEPVALGPRDKHASFGSRARRIVQRVATGSSIVAFLFLVAGADSLAWAVGFWISLWAAVALYPSKKRRNERGYILQQASKTWASLLQRWNEECSSQKFDEALSRLQHIRLEMDELALRRKRELREYLKSGVERARRQFLAAFRIEQIPSQTLTRSQRATLNNFGIGTAADIERYEAEIPNLVSARAAQELLAWYRMHLRSFTPPQDAVPDPQKIASIEQRYDHMQERLAKQLSEGPELLRQTSEEILAARNRLKTPLRSAWESLSRAQQQ